jgi:two-component system OmpR family sensor kinase
MFNSLPARLLLSYIVIIGVCLLVVSVALILLLRPLSERAALSDLAGVSGAQLAAAEDAGQAGPVGVELAQRMADNAARRARVRVLLLDDNHRVQYDSDNPQSRLLGVDLSRRWTSDFLSDDMQGGTFPEPGAGLFYFVVTPWPAPRGNNVRYVVFARAAPARFPLLQLFREGFVTQIVFAGLVALAVSVVLAWLIARSVVDPLRVVARGAHAVAQGDYGHTVPIGGPQEVRELGSAFNLMSERVRASQQAQRDFVANVSHELKTPLTSIQGFSQAIVDGAASDPASVRHAGNIIHDEAQRLRRLADDLLELARLDAGQITLQRAPCDLAAVLRACAERLALRAQEAGVTLDLSGVPAALPLTGDGDRLAQVFTNLLDNALQHTPAGGRVTLRAGAGQRGTVVQVTDTGKGIPAADLPRVFERFYQVDKSRARNGGGAGLGLAIVRELVQAHGGAVKVESTEGQGTTFTVILPKG